MPADDFLNAGVSGDMSDPVLRRAWLIRYGYHHLVGLDETEAERLDPQSSEMRAMMAAAQSKFVARYGREPDGITGPVTERELGAPRCGHPDHRPFDQAGALKWSDVCNDRLQIRAALDGIRGISVEQAESLWYRVWEVNRATCGVNFVKVDSTSEAHSWCQVGNTGAGVLAYQYYPTSCGSLPTNGGVYSSSTNWDAELFFTTALHEEGHKLGLDHGEIDEVMYYRINKRVTDWRPGDKQRLIRRYGEPDGTPVTPGDSVQLTLNKDLPAGTYKVSTGSGDDSGGWFEFV